MAKNLFFVRYIKNIRSEKTKILLAQLLGNIIVHIHANFRKDRWKVREPIQFEKMLTDRQIDGRLGIR